MQLRVAIATALGGTLLLGAIGCQEGQEAPSVDGLTTPYPAEDCPSCAGWNEPQQPLHLHGNTYYVGTRGLASLLITSADGHILIDGGLPDSAPLIIENIRALGFDVADVELIVNSHVHFDHAGGIAALQRASGARVAASEPSAPVLESGRSGEDDPQFGLLFDLPAVGPVERFSDGETLRVGELAITAHLTPGHTPGGTSWSWVSCDNARCLTFVYADSQTPISAEGFRFSENTTYPSAVDDFRRGFAVLERLPCEILITPHPGASSMWERLEGEGDGLVDPQACKSYVARARQQLDRRLEREAAGEL